MDWLMAGLGNPGEEYARTRHNAGWMIIDAFAAKHGADFGQGRTQSLDCEMRYASKNITLVKPLTYMNLSGRAIKYYKNQYKLTPKQIIVIVDEYNFPTGKLHLRAGGSDGGHNGLASCIEELGGDGFYRLRAGIDKHFGPGGLVDYVLGPFSAEQQPALEMMIENGVKALEAIIKAGPQRAMSDINSGKLFEK